MTFDFVIVVYALSHKCCNGTLLSFPLSPPSMLNLSVLVSRSKRNVVNATLKEEGGGVCAIWARCDFFCGFSVLFQLIMTELLATLNAFQCVQYTMNKELLNLKNSVTLFISYMYFLLIILFCFLLSFADLSRALVITELGTSREVPNMAVVQKNFRTLAEEPVRVHG